MVSTLDFRRFLPGVVPQDLGMFTGGTASGPGSFSVPVQPGGAPQQVPPPEAPKPPPENPPETNNFGAFNPTGKPPVMAGVGGATTLSPMGTTSTVTPPVTPAGLKEVYGPGASQSSVTQAPTKPIEPAFNPDVREAVRGATAAQAAGTPAVQAGNIYDKLMEMQKDPKFGGAIAALAKSFGSGKGGPAPPPAWHSSMHPGNPGFNAGNPGSASQILQGLTGGAEKREAERKKKPRRNERDRYDILGRG